MKSQPYLCGSGYHREKHLGGRDEFFPIWMRNLQKLTPLPQQLIIIADTGARPPMDDLSAAPPFPVTVIPLTGDLGNAHALLHGIKPHKFSGWTGAVCAAAMIAYCDELDFIFVEQDVLSVGDVIGRMYEEIGDAGIIYGKCDWMPAEQSLFLVRHFYIPEFVRLFLSQGRQNVEENLGEHLFLKMTHENPTMWYQFSMQFGRNRPINFDEPVWYAQKFTPEELQELKRRNLI